MRPPKTVRTSLTHRPLPLSLVPQETWQWIPVNLLHPDMAQSLLQYRVEHIAGAERNARERNESGARFPWESARTGEETATYGPCGDRELHVNGDIAFAVWQFWRALGDDSGAWLEETAWPLLSGISTFWMSRLAADNAGSAPGAALSINDVMCPDEYADHVNNSAFTNVVARYTLQHAAAVAQLLGLPPANYTPWLDAAARIVLQPFDNDLSFTPEFDGYKSGSTIKQADVILLGYPFDEPSMTAATRAANLKYYSQVTDAGGPAMTCKYPTQPRTPLTTIRKSDDPIFRRL